MEIKMEQIAKMYGEEHTAYWNKNKMAEVAKLFNKKLGERFTVRYDNYQFSCYFSDCGFCACGVYDNPYLDFDPFILQDLLTGRAVIINA